MTLTADDILQIHALLADYGHIVDDHDWGRVDEVFAEDFIFDRSAYGIPDLHGAADIIRTFLGRNMYAHFTGNTTLTEAIDGVVNAHSKFIAFPNDGPPMTGDYYDTIVLTQAGWRLQRRRAETRQRKFFD
ncbi:MAG TPA: nuclear transport factor 2 family protein [Thermomicrobiales bacterium]|nr:nuclear transport factor 2 family protein [Chloroflexota bacterium]HCG28888.1 nuclear transport factor 2 family protein [Chloroflexota bacterium]HQZ91164.1 nuclear transport factor 2 family protein [Thermomicrobiales bacterium]HRA32934.1 nuclear transport factor 2 family protein [Thermomicrobiales bacterium]